MSAAQPEAILVLPHLRVQNANAISSPMTHGFPSITAFTGLMWALQRKLSDAGVPLQLHGVGVICHAHQEQASQGYVRTFNLTRNPVDSIGATSAIAEEGRMHLEVTLVFSASEQRAVGTVPALVADQEASLTQWAERAGELVAQMRIAGGSVLPVRRLPGQRTRPWMAPIAEEAQAQAVQFRTWRRTWLPGYALVERSDLLPERLTYLRERMPEATMVDAWLHAARFNHEAVTATGSANGSSSAPSAEPMPAANSKVTWADPRRGKGQGWTVPIPVGYAALAPLYAAGSVRSARDDQAPLRFVESVYGFGEWISPHRLGHLRQLLWHAHTDSANGLYRCSNAYRAPKAADDSERDDDWDIDESYQTIASDAPG